MVCGLSCFMACGILVPRPGIEPTSPELEGRFFTTGPLGKSLFLLLMEYCSYFTDVIASLLSPGILLFSFLKKINLFIYFWLCWVFVSARGLSLVAESGGHSSSRCTGLSLSRPLLLQGTGSRRAGSVVVAHGPSCSAACGILPDQGSNLCPLHWQADSQPLRHQGSPYFPFLKFFLSTFFSLSFWFLTYGLFHVTFYLY